MFNPFVNVFVLFYSRRGKIYLTSNKIDSNSSRCPLLIREVEVRVKATKRSLLYLPTSSLSILEFNALLKNIPLTINNLSFGFQVLENQLLLGHNYDAVHPSDS